MHDIYSEISKELELVEKSIKESSATRNKTLSNVVNELIEAGGKRLRPAFVVLSAKFGKYDRKKVIPAAGAIEVLHTATLVHDDIIDNAKLRRGKVTVSEKYGSEMAIYVGDYLFTKAVFMLSEGLSLDKLSIVARAMKIICEGEVDQFGDRFNIDTTIYSYLKRSSRKTAVLFAAACSMGAHLGKCPDRTVKWLTRFGFNYGMAFQIRDDINDFLSDVPLSGKPVGNDILKGQITLPAIYAIKNSIDAKDAFIKTIKKNQPISNDDVRLLIKLVNQYGGIEEAKAMLERYILKAMTALSELPDIDYKLILKNHLEKLKI